MNAAAAAAIPNLRTVDIVFRAPPARSRRRGEFWGRWRSRSWSDQCAGGRSSCRMFFRNPADGYVNTDNTYSSLFRVNKCYVNHGIAQHMVSYLVFALTKLLW
jgi:hypothetical protein